MVAASGALCDEALRDDALGAGVAGGVGVGVLTVGVLSALVAVVAELVLDAAGFPALVDASEPVWAPPVFCTMPVRGSGVAAGLADDGLPVAADDVVETVVSVGEFEPDEVDADGELAETLDLPLVSVDEEAEELDEVEADGSASANPGWVAVANPTPSANANAPTRPTWLA